tara:strand:- start:1381 stop:2007 length:627 start_codon:yes stop_codon:yes gene_type:complete
MKIGITMRVSIFKNERRDCIDQEWFNYFEKFGFELIPIPNTKDDLNRYIKNSNLNGLILSGGNDINGLKGAVQTAPERDKTELVILDYAYEKQIPVLGVCRGMQMINYYFKGGFSISTNHVNVIHNLKRINSNYSFPRFTKVNSFHNFVIPQHKIGKGLIPIYLSDDGNIESFIHERLPWVGIMWHPERDKVQDKNSIVLLNQIFKLD